MISDLNLEFKFNKKKKKKKQLIFVIYKSV
jgi:hypothetical protein